MSAQQKRAAREQRKREIELERERRGDSQATLALLALDDQLDRRSRLSLVRQRRAFYRFDKLEARTAPGCPRFADSIEVHVAVAEMRRERTPRLRCERCAHEATVEAGGSYYCDEHGGFAQIAHRHGLVSIKAVSR